MLGPSLAALESPVRHTLLALSVGVVCVTSASACWVAIKPEHYAAGCPVIVRGTIVAVEVSKEEGTGEKRVDDLAEIEITEVVWNEFKDVPLKAGGKLKVRMVSATKNSLRTSIDLNYPVKTEALWLLSVDDAGEFRIDRHPVQKQPIDARIDPKAYRMKERKVLKEQPAEEKLAEKDDPGVVRGEVLKADWLKERAKAQAEEAKREAEYRLKREAEEKAIRELAAGMADADRVNAPTMKAFLAAPVDIRRSVIQQRGDSPLTGDRLVDVAEYVATHDPDENVRVHAVCRLGGDDLKENTQAGRVLAARLKDTSAEVRKYACQALWLHADPDHGPDARPLLTDTDRQVRLTAVAAVGRLGDKKAVPEVLKLYESEKPAADDAVTFAECLARLGEEKVSVAAAVKAMTSDNWNVRYFAVAALGHVKGDAAVAPLVACLGMELKRIVAGEKNTGFDERMYQTACKLLADRTGESHGLDPVAWADWWATARRKYDGAEWKLNREDAAKAFAEYQKKADK